MPTRITHRIDICASSATGISYPFSTIPRTPPSYDRDLGMGRLVRANNDLPNRLLPR